jgi:hypothetical protein
LSDALLAVLDQDGYRMNRFITSAITSRIFPSFVRNLNTDPYWRETRTLIDRVRSASPYFSEFGEIRYDFLGEPDKKPGTTLGRLINPFMVTEDTGDIVYEALNDLNHTITPPPQAKNGIQYSEFILPNENNKNAYEKYNELIGTVLINDKTLRQALEEYIQSPQYEEATKPYKFDERNFYKGGKITRIEEIVRDYREKAEGELFKLKPISKTNEDLHLEEAIYNKKYNVIDYNNNYKKNISDLFQIK